MPTDIPIVLLGAGASVPANIPAVFEMTTKVGDHLNGLRDDRLIGAFNLVAGGLQMSGRELGKVDIEQVLTIARLLQDRSRIELTPFVASWHPLVERVDRAEPSYGSIDKVTSELRRVLEMDREDRDQRSRGVDLGSFQHALTTLTREISSPRSGNIFGSLIEHIFAAIVQLAWLPHDDETAKRTAYLAPLCRPAARGPFVVASLNYDNAVERCAATNRTLITTCINSWQQRRMVNAAPNGIELLKLHGSANWFWNEGDKDVGELTDEEMEDLRQKIRGNESWSKSVGRALAIVFGADNKLTARGPFLDLLARFKAALFASNRLITVGYSFRDEHVNHIVRHWLSATADARVDIISSDDGQHGATRDRAFMNHPSSKVLADKFGQRVEFHPIGAKTGLKRLLQ